MKIYSLSEFCNKIGVGLKSYFTDTYLITAEISGMQVRSGHCYMELVEKGKNNSIYDARMRAICWSSTYTMLSAYFAHETGQSLQNGMKVLVEVEVNFHNTYGLSLIIVGIDPKYTLGDLQQQRKKTIEQLKREGIFDMNRMLSLPALPHRIAVISSPEAAGYEDFCNQLTTNSQHYAFSITLFKAVMQGDSASDSICNALNQINEQINEFDLVLITRGGGSTNDLTCFDDYQLCAYIAQFPIPVITAIGHTKDISIADQVAYKALKTPTAAAAYLIELFDMKADEIANLEQRMRLALTNLSKNKLLQLENYKNRLLNACKMQIQKQLNNLELIEHTIQLQSPQRILKQGYTITLKNDKPIRSAHDINAGDLLQTDFADGTIQSVAQ